MVVLRASVHDAAARDLDADAVLLNFLSRLLLKIATTQQAGGTSLVDRVVLDSTNGGTRSREREYQLNT